MAILTKPTIQKGQANEFDLSKSELAVLSKVTSDSYFSDQANWSKVIVEYKSAEGNQHEMVIFDASQESPKGNFEISEKAKDSWEVQSVKIIDFDGGFLRINRGDLTVADFDIVLTSLQGVNGVNWDNPPASLNATPTSIDGFSGEYVFGTNKSNNAFCSIEFTPQSLSSAYVGIAGTSTAISEVPSGIYTHDLNFSAAGNVTVYSSGGSDQIYATTYVGDGSEVFKVEFLGDRVEYSKNGTVFFTDNSPKPGDVNNPFSGHPPFFPKVYVASGTFTVTDIGITGFDD